MASRVSCCILEGTSPRLNSMSQAQLCPSLLSEQKKVAAKSTKVRTMNILNSTVLKKSIDKVDDVGKKLKSVQIAITCFVLSIKSNACIYASFTQSSFAHINMFNLSCSIHHMKHKACADHPMKFCLQQY